MDIIGRQWIRKDWGAVQRHTSFEVSSEKSWRVTSNARKSLIRDIVVRLKVVILLNYYAYWHTYTSIVSTLWP